MRHRNNARAQVSSPREDEESEQTSGGDLSAATGLVPGSERRPGKNFFLTMQRPVKYQIAKRLTRQMYQCLHCVSRFRSAGLLRRHKSTQHHKKMARLCRQRAQSLSEPMKRWKQLLLRMTTRKLQFLNRIAYLRKIRTKSIQLL